MCKALKLLLKLSFHKRWDGVAMGSSLGPTLLNSFLCYHEKNG